MRTLSFAAIALCLLMRPVMATEVHEVHSQSGITAWLIEDHSLPLISMRIIFKEAGMASDPKTLSGRAYLAGELIYEGSGKYDALSFQKALEEHAIKLSTGVDADFTRISLQTLSEHRDTAFELLGGMLTAPRFDDEAIARVRKATQIMLSQAEASPGYQLQRAWQEAVFAGHPYANPPYGTPQSVTNISAADLKAFTQRYYTKENIIIGVAGDITPEQLSLLLDQHLARLSAKFAPETTVPEVPFPTKGQVKTVNKPIPQTMASFGVAAPKRTDDAYMTAFVMNQVLGGGGSLNSRLGEEIREKRGLAYYVSSDISGLLHSGALQGNFATRNAKISEAVDLLKENFTRMQEDGITQKELDDAKQYLTGSFVLNLDTNNDLAAYLVSMQIYGLGKDYLEKRNSLIESVTLKQVNALAKTLLDAQHLVIVLVGNPDESATQNTAH